MGRHSAPGDDELDAGTDSGQGSIAVTQELAAGPGRQAGRHSSQDDAEPDADGPEPSSDESADDPTGGSVRTGGLDLIEDALHGPDSEPLPTVRQPRRPAPPVGADLHAHPGPDGHDAPTDRLPTVDDSAVERTDRIPTIHDAAVERTDRIPTIADATVPATAHDGAEAPPIEPAVSEVGVDSSGPVVATVDPADQQPAPAARPPRRGTIGDLGLIRRHGDVRARVIAAVIVPFAAFFGVLGVAGELGVRRLIWIWIPAVTAGVLIGLLLDAGHRRYPDASVTEPADPSTPPRTH